MSIHWRETIQRFEEIENAGNRRPRSGLTYRELIRVTTASARTAAARILVFWLVATTARTILEAQFDASRSSFAITHVTVVDTVIGTAREDMTVAIRGDRIVEVGKSDVVRLWPASSIVDGRGKFLIPGLWDMHVHVFNNGDQNGTDSSAHFFPLLVANGVLGVRDMSTDPEDIEQARRWNREIDEGRLIAPRVSVTSRLIDGEPQTWSNSMVVRAADEAKRAVRMLKGSGAKTIKVYWNLSRDAYFAIAEESKRQRIPFAGHVPRVVGAGEASNAGQLTIEHLDSIAQACSSKESEWLSKRQAGTWTPADAVEMRRTFDASRCEQLARRFNRKGTWLVPTTIVFFDPKGIDLPGRLRYASPRGADRIKQKIPKPGDRADAVTRRAELDMRRIMLREVSSSLFMAGTDLSRMRPSDLPGFSLHDELALFVELGFTPAQALRAATYNAAKLDTRLRDYGSVDRGKRADLVLLNANPLEEIQNTRNIDSVILNGAILDRAKLNALLSAGETAARKQ